MNTMNKYSLRDMCGCWSSSSWVINRVRALANTDVFTVAMFTIGLMEFTSAERAQLDAIIEELQEGEES